MHLLLAVQTEDLKRSGCLQFDLPGQRYSDMLRYNQVAVLGRLINPGEFSAVALFNCSGLAACCPCAGTAVKIAANTMIRNVAAFRQTDFSFVSKSILETHRTTLIRTISNLFRILIFITPSNLLLAYLLIQETTVVVSYFDPILVCQPSNLGYA